MLSTFIRKFYQSKGGLIKNTDTSKGIKYYCTYYIPKFKYQYGYL